MKVLKIIFTPFILIFKLIYKLIDFLIITPISRIIYRVNDLLKNNSNKFEKILNRPNVLIYVSLLCAVSLFLLVENQVINLTEREAEIIRDQKVNVIYNTEAYVVEGAPEAVDITLIGAKGSVALATQLGSHEVVLDLAKYGPGTYKVKLKYNHTVEAVDYKLDPSTVTVKISPKVSKAMNVQYDLMNEDKLDEKLSVSKVSIDTTEVIVKSSQEILNKVAVVKALVDASKVNLKESGDFKIEDVPLIAYDANGDKLEYVEMVPSKVTATVTIDSYHATKQVRVVTTGTIAPGKAILSASPDVTEVEVYGEKSIVDNISVINAEVPLDNISSDKSVSVDLVRPAGVRYISKTKANVNVKVGNESQRTIEGVTITTVNLADGLSAGLAEDESTISVILKGVESVINNSDVNESSVRAYVDLSGLGAGTHDLPIKVEITDYRITAQPVKTEVKVVIRRR